jgi:hypothetical protein
MTQRKRAEEDKENINIARLISSDGFSSGIFLIDYN